MSGPTAFPYTPKGPGPIYQVAAPAAVSIGELLLYADALAGAESFHVFTYTGAYESWTVPAGVTSLRVEAYGAQGGNASTSGGLGAFGNVRVAVTAGEVLRVYVPGVGVGSGVSHAGGFPNGGDGQTSTAIESAGGGGAAEVRRSPYTTADRLFSVGGGGGASQLTGAGGDAGTTAGSNGTGPSPGGGATLTAGGAAGGGTATAGSTTGQGGNGGSGDGGFRSGGGGGGGVCGGGGGSSDGSSGSGSGGGGGSSNLIASGSVLTLTAGVRSGNGEITFFWAP